MVSVHMIKQNEIKLCSKKINLFPMIKGNHFLCSISSSHTKHTMESIEQVIEQLEPVMDLITNRLEDIADIQNATYRSILSKAKSGEEFKHYVISYEPAAYFRNKANFDAVAQEITFPFEIVDFDDSETEAETETNTTATTGAGEIKTE
jgi:hypothetical protein